MKPLLLLLAAATLQAQITGKIVDAFGAPVAGAAVLVKNASGQEFKTATGAAGEYQLDVPAGSYEVTASRMTFQSFKQAITVEPNRSLKLDVALRDADTLGTLGDGDSASAAFYNSLPKTPVPEGPTPRLADGKPDLSGYWVMANTNPGILTVPARRWASAIRDERQASAQRDNPYGFCLPGSVIMMAGAGKIVHTKNYIVILNSGEPARQIFLDGRSHPSDLNPTWQGHSIGHWEGDTLVVDTAGFNGRSWYGGGFASTEQLHLTERYTRADLGHLTIEITIDDPPALERPWTAIRTSSLNPTRELEEYICDENNRDAQHLLPK